MSTKTQAHSLVVKSNPNDDSSPKALYLEIDGKEFLASELKLDIGRKIINATVTFSLYSLDVDVAAETTVNDIEKENTDLRRIKLTATKDSNYTYLDVATGKEMIGLHLLQGIDVKPIVSEPDLGDDTDNTVSNSINSITIHAKAFEADVKAEISCNPFKTVLGHKAGAPAKISLNKLVEQSTTEPNQYVMVVNPSLAN